MEYSGKAVIASVALVVACGSGTSMPCRTNTDCGGILVCRQSECVFPDIDGSGAGGYGTTSGASNGTAASHAACDACLAQQCAVEQSNCTADVECSAIEACYQDCNTSSCISDCIGTHLGGLTYFGLLADCYDTRCHSSCDASTPAIEVPYGLGGYVGRGGAYSVPSSGTSVQGGTNYVGVGGTTSRGGTSTRSVGGAVSTASTLYVIASGGRATGGASTVYLLASGGRATGGTIAMGGRATGGTTTMASGGRATGGTTTMASGGRAAGGTTFTTPGSGGSRATVTGGSAFGGYATGGYATGGEITLGGSFSAATSTVTGGTSTGGNLGNSFGSVSLAGAAGHAPAGSAPAD